MMKKFFTTFFTITLGIILSSGVYAQEAPSETPEDSQPEVVADDAGSSAETTAVESTKAEKAMTHFDGVNTYANARVLFKLKSSDNFQADKILYKVDNNEEKTYEKEFNITEEGKHSISYYGVDKMGNKEDSKSLNVIIDNTAPEIMVNTNTPLFKKGDKYYVSKAVSFTVASTDNLSGIKKTSYSLSDTESVEYSTSFNIYKNGDFTLKLNSDDNVGNKSSKFKIKLQDENGAMTEVEKDSLSIFSDNTAPEVKIASEKELQQLNGKTIAPKDNTYTITATDAEAGVKTIYVRVDGKGDFVPYSSAIKFNTNGDHFIEAKAVDAVGNISDIEIISVYVDIIPPKSTIEVIAE